MPGDYTGKQFKTRTPATYLIEVEGFLDESWSNRLGGMRINTRKRAEQTTVSTLVGRVRDQAELTGILNSLYDLHYPILSVKNITEDDGEGRPDPDKSTKVVLRP